MKLVVKTEDNGEVYTGDASLNPIFDPSIQSTTFLMALYEDILANTEYDLWNIPFTDFGTLWAVQDELKARNILA